MTKESIINHAANFRRTNFLNDIEPISLKALLLKLNILTVFRPMSENFSGMAFKLNLENCPGCILVNSNHSRGRQRFSVAHELFHLYFQENFKSSASHISDPNDKNEKNANLFASHFLLPEQGLLNIIPEHERKKNTITLATILRIEQYYQISRNQLVIRLLDKNYIDKLYAKTLNSSIKSSALKHGYSTDLYEKTGINLIIGNYGEKAFQAWEKGIISESKYIQLLHEAGIDVSKIYDDE